LARRSPKSSGSRRTPLERAKARKADGLRPATSEGVAGYVRVSSASQTLDSQRDAIGRACAARGEAIGQWFEDQGSGKSLARPGLQALRSAVQSGSVRTVYVYRLDRLTRSGIRDTLGLLQELGGRGATVRSVADALPDVDGPFGEVFLALLAWCNQVEREVIRERQAAARARLEAAGKGWGRPPRLTAERRAWFRRQLEQRTARDLERETGIPRSTILRCRGDAKSKAAR
jgi:DNA invertase Pin-like site-specific DNA recombinase